MKKYIHNQIFKLESGEVIQNLEIAYHTYGKMNKNSDNVIWVFHAISGDSNVLDWWPGLFGPGCLYDPEEYFIICANTIGSPYGSSMPIDLDFPNFTVRDVVNAHYILARALNITRIHTAIGASFGGYQALEFAYSFTGQLDHLILMASSAKESAWGIAIHESQRIAMKSDPGFGRPGGGQAGMKAARSIAMLTYRTSQSFINSQTDPDNVMDNFKASSYIHYQGDKFVQRFNPLSYYYLTKCIDSHNIGRRRGGQVAALKKIDIPALVIGFSSDTLVPVRFQRFLAEHMRNAVFQEFNSEYGHDGFLKENEKITESVTSFYKDVNNGKSNARRTILKFGGSSLHGKMKMDKVLKIVEQQYRNGPIALVVSARGKSTDLLEQCYRLAVKGKDFTHEFDSFRKYQEDIIPEPGLYEDFRELKEILEATSLLKEKNEFVHDRILSFGEIISAKCITRFLSTNGLKARFIDARKIIFTKKTYEDFEVDIDKSQTATQELFNRIPANVIPVITGFIACCENGKTVTLGRNGSNYSATLIGSFVHAEAVQNWTDVEGVFSADPSIIPNAIPIREMTYKEANEMANFGVNLLHPKTIQPLLQSKIPLIIKNTLSPESVGTIINNEGGEKGIKAVTLINEVALVTLEGSELSEKIGIDARIFSALYKKKISVKMISQASSERGIGFVISNKDIKDAEIVLSEEFQQELKLEQISSIRVNEDIGIVAIIGRHNYALEKAIKALRRNRIWMHLITNSISGEHISLVIDNTQLEKAARLVHNEIFGVIKTVNVFAFGKGHVGANLIDQIISTSSSLIEERKLNIKVIGIADSKQVLINEHGLELNWRKELLSKGKSKTIPEIIKTLKSFRFENLIIADNTSSKDISDQYVNFLNANFDIVASNKKANSTSLENYNSIRKVIAKKGRHFYYEANVGAGLPVLDYIKSLYQTSDKITKIRGVLSGSLSYMFNRFSSSNRPFSCFFEDARLSGYTEPDPREDLEGMDVARKLIILAREINFMKELEKVEVESLIPDSLTKIDDYKTFVEYSDILDEYYEEIRNELENDEVLRYVGELDVQGNSLRTRLERIKKNTPLGQLKSADSLIEIYTESYGDQPIVIQGAGAGPVVTARAVYTDIIRIGRQL